MDIDNEKESGLDGGLGISDLVGERSSKERFSTATYKVTAVLGITAVLRLSGTNRFHFHRQDEF